MNCLLFSDHGRHRQTRLAPQSPDLETRSARSLLRSPSNFPVQRSDLKVWIQRMCARYSAVALASFAGHHNLKPLLLSSSAMSIEIAKLYLEPNPSQTQTISP